MDDYNSFSSIDSLMQFGMGLAVANQMVGMMNQTMASMQTAGVDRPFTQGIEQCYVLINKAIAGPFSEQELGTLAHIKTLTPDTLVWKRGMPGWMQAKNVSWAQKVILLNN